MGGFDDRPAPPTNRVPSPNHQGLMEPRYWVPEDIGDEYPEAMCSEGQPGPSSTYVAVDRRGVWVQALPTTRRLGPGETRWLAMRLIEAAARYEALFDDRNQLTPDRVVDGD